MTTRVIMAKMTMRSLFTLVLMSAINLSWTEINIPANEIVLEQLSSYLCSELTLSEDEMESCQINFTSEHRNLTGEPPELEVQCQSHSRITFNLTESPTAQIVVLMPEDEDPDLIKWLVIDEYEEYFEMSAVTPGNYTFWTAVLNDDLSPSCWLRGPEINFSSKRESKTYIIKHEFINLGNRIMASFTWNASADFCFDVVNYCNKLELGDFFHKKITPSDDRRVQVGGLPFEDKCVFRVSGRYGTTELKYHTPSCDDLEGCEYDLLPPEIPKNITLYATSSLNGAWDVLVRWQRPKHPPQRHTVTIRTSNEIKTVHLSGNETEVIFLDVNGTGIYNVSVWSVNSVAEAHSSARAIFPSLAAAEETRFPELALMAAAMCAVFAVATMAVVLWHRRRRGVARNLYLQGIEDKLEKDCSSNTGGSESGVDDSWEIRSERVLLHEVIGEGAFGVVRRGTLTSLVGDKEVAVKMLKDFPSVEEIRSFRAEMELMKSVGGHPHVVSLVGCCSGRRPLIVAQYCSKGDLLTYLRCCWDVMVSKRNAKYYNSNSDSSDYRNDLFKNKSRLVVNKLYDMNGVCDPELTSIDLLSFCRQIAMGMEFLALNRVVHRDLAARNVLVGGDRTLKIADFGLSRDVYQENQYKQKGNGKMPVKWMAPESLTHRIYTTQSDVWSYGVVIWEIVTVGGAPYPEVPAARLPRLLRAGYRMPRPNNCSKQLYEVMLSCWRERSRERPTFCELHRELDTLLNSACADTYLSLEMSDDAPPPPLSITHRYFRIITRGKRPWTRGESYERPLKASQSNLYTSPPDSLNRS